MKNPHVQFQKKEGTEPGDSCFQAFGPHQLDMYMYMYVQYRSDARARVNYTSLHEEANTLVH